MSPGIRFSGLARVRCGRSATLWTYMPSQPSAAAAAIRYRDRDSSMARQLHEHSGPGCESASTAANGARHTA
jgi:hypothetical protein